MLLHGLTATRRYVVMGSRALERSGHRVLAYDARGHGRSAPGAGRRLRLRAPRRRPRRGARRGRHRARGARGRLDGRAHALCASRSSTPSAWPALALITPAFDPARRAPSARAGAAGTRSRAGCARAASRASSRRTTSTRVPPSAGARRSRRVLRQRLSAHEHPRRSPTRSKSCRARAPFESLGELAAIAAPTVVVASRDEADPGHPLAVGERYARARSRARGWSSSARPPARSPIAWQGGQLSRVLAELADAASP